MNDEAPGKSQGPGRTPGFSDHLASDKARNVAGDRNESTHGSGAALPHTDLLRPRKQSHILSISWGDLERRHNSAVHA